MDSRKLAVALFWHAIHIAFYGVALRFLWDWFMPPAMHAATLTFSVAFGLVCMFCMLFTKIHSARTITVQNVVEEALTPALFTLFGFLIHMFVHF